MRLMQKKNRASYAKLCRGMFQNTCIRSFLFIHGKIRLGYLLVLEGGDIGIGSVSGCFH